MIQDYTEIVFNLDQRFEWCKANSAIVNSVTESADNKKFNQWTAMIFGECGQGKSTTLNKIVEIVADKYYKGQ